MGAGFSLCLSVGERKCVCRCGCPAERLPSFSVCAPSNTAMCVVVALCLLFVCFACATTKDDKAKTVKRLLDVRLGGLAETKSTLACPRGTGSVSASGSAFADSKTNQRAQIANFENMTGTSRANFSYKIKNELGTHFVFR